MPTDKFLVAVADYYLNATPTDLSELCLVFPNKRAAIFFRRYFKQRAKGITFIPQITTIGALNERFSQRKVADHIELMFILYSAYRNVIQQHGQTPMEFDRFAFWGNMILSDFDDIDAEMADAKSLFTNVYRLNEISSNYLTPEQLDVVRSIWGKETYASFKSDDDKFWNHIDTDDDTDKPSTKFHKLWQILLPLYDEFNRILSEKGLAYPGLISREISNTISTIDFDDLSFKRIGFVGFNRINLSLAKLMQALDKKGRADFFWDVLPDLNFCKRAGSRIARLKDCFKMPETYEPPTYNFENCDINVYAVPSNTLQAKAAGNVIENWLKSINTELPDNTVIVLPEPAMLSPVLTALPGKLDSINITMGLSYKDTPFASMLRAIISLHMRCRFIKDEPYYFHEDIATLIAHPNLRAIALNACMAIKAHLDKYHQYNVPAETLRQMIASSVQCLTPDNEYTENEAKSIIGAEALMRVFQEVEDAHDVSQVKAYLHNLIEALRNALVVSVPRINQDAHEIKVLDAYEVAIDYIFECIEKYHIAGIKQGSIFNMLERLLSTCTINMSGTPLSGLQIMGVLETRAIDFDNVIIMSMNERIYPRRNRQHSLIPQQLRHAYYLPANDDTEQEYSYYFYRLFSRAKRVVCFYDSRANAAGNGAMSRYLLQMKYLSPSKNIHYNTAAINTLVGEQRNISIQKTDDIMNELNAFKATDDSALNLSASALKKYRSCKLRFYLEYVKRIKEDNEPQAFMDAATYGSVMHNVLQQLFIEQRSNKDSKLPVLIDKQTLIRMRGSSGSILLRVKREINRLYHQNLYTDRLDYLPAESAILAEIMAEFIDKIIDKEIQFVENKYIDPKDPTYTGTFSFIDAEESITRPWQASPNHKINFRLDIDRHDKMNDGIHRFVDYKTGSDKPDFSNIDTLFSAIDDKANDACFQLLTYAAAYSEIKGLDKNIRFSIYRLMTAADVTSDFYRHGDRLRITDRKSPVNPIIWVNDSEDKPEWQIAFRERLADMIDEIFNPDVPFTQTEHIDNCKYCKFVQMCARIVPDNNR